MKIEKSIFNRGKNILREDHDKQTSRNLHSSFPRVRQPTRPHCRLLYYRELFQTQLFFSKTSKLALNEFSVSKFFWPQTKVYLHFVFWLFLQNSIHFLGLLLGWLLQRRLGNQAARLDTPLHQTTIAITNT